MKRGRYGQYECEHGEENRTKNNRCRACMLERQHAWRLANLERERARDRERQTPERQRNAYLRRKYGISLEVERQMFEAQDGCCATCQKPMMKACVDHDHRTGRVRDLLCGTCNSALGYVDDDTDLLLALRDYVLRHRAAAEALVITDR